MGIGEGAGAVQGKKCQSGEKSGGVLKIVKEFENLEKSFGFWLEIKRYQQGKNGIWVDEERIALIEYKLKTNHQGILKIKDEFWIDHPKT